MNVRIHTQGWVEDHGRDAGEEANASIHVLLELDGKLIEDVTRVAVVASNKDFTKVVATLIPGELETVVHDRESWARLLNPRRAVYGEVFDQERQPPRSPVT